MMNPSESFDRRTDSFESAVLSGLTHAREGDLPLAEEAFRHALLLQPHDRTVRRNLAAVLVRMGDFDAAYGTLVAGLGGLETDLPYLRQVAHYSLATGALDSATGLLQRLLAAQPGDSATKFLLADVLCQRGRYQDAQALFDGLADDSWVDVTGYALRPLWLLGRFELLERVVKSEELLAAEPQALFNLGTIQIRNDRLEEALSNLNCSIALQPGIASAVFNRGICSYLLNDVPTALSDWNQAVRLSPDVTHFSTFLHSMWIQDVAAEFTNALASGKAIGRTVQSVIERTVKNPHAVPAVSDFLIRCGLFDPVRAICNSLQADAQDDGYTDSLFASVMTRCLATELASVEQMDYEISEYGHLDVRNLTSALTSLTGFLQRSSKDLLAELTCLFEVSEELAADEQGCMLICDVAFRSGDMQRAIRAAVKFQRSAQATSDRVLRARAFAEYAIGGTISARYLLQKAQDHHSYRLGRFVKASTASSYRFPLGSQPYQDNISVTMPVWQSGQEMTVTQKLSIPPPTLQVFENAILLNDNGTLVVDEDAIVRETMNCDPSRYIYGWPNVTHAVGDKALIHCPPPQESVQCQVILASFSRDQANYAHWMLDVLPRILVGHSNEHVRAAPILLTKEPTPWQEEALRIFGVERSRVVSVDATAPIRLRNVVLPVTTHDLYPTPYSIKVLRRALTFSGALSSGKPTRRLYVPRRARFRRVLNEDQIGALLAKLGFEEISPGDLSVASQIKAFSEAEIVVAAGGAAVTNALFMQPGTALVVYGPNTNYGTYFSYIAQQLAIRYAGVVGSPSPDLVNTYVGWNFSLDVSDVELAIRATAPDLLHTA